MAKSEKAASSQAKPPLRGPAERRGDDPVDNTFNPDTQIVVNKRKFEELMFHLGTNRTATYVRHATIQRLADLLELEGGLEEARDIYTKMVERVMAG